MKQLKIILILLLIMVIIISCTNPLPTNNINGIPSISSTPIPTISPFTEITSKPTQISENNKENEITTLEFFNGLEFIELDSNIENKKGEITKQTKKLDCEYVSQTKFSYLEKDEIHCKGNYIIYENSNQTIYLGNLKVKLKNKEETYIEKISYENWTDITPQGITYTDEYKKNNSQGYSDDVYLLSKVKIKDKIIVIYIIIDNQYLLDCCNSLLELSEIKEKTTFYGKIKDPYGNDVQGSKVSARSIDPGVNWIGETQYTINGEYIFKDAPVGSRVEITAYKEDWSTRTRVEVLKSNLTGDTLANKFDFVGQYSLQDEPEITEVFINGRKATNIGSIDASNKIPNNNDGVTLSGITHDNLEITLNFSEPVRRDDIQNYFRVVSQNFDVLNNNNFIIDKNIFGLTFIWNDNDTSVTFETNKAILANKEGNEARYKLEFTQPFRDKTDKKAIEGQYIRFSPFTRGDFTLLSVKNDEQDPSLSSVQALDGGSNNDKLVLTFNEPLEVLNKTIVQAGLYDPDAPDISDRQLWISSTNNIGIVPENQTGINNVTLLGYSTDGTAKGFKAMYVIGRIKDPISDARKQLYPLNGYGWNDVTNTLEPISPKKTDNIQLMLSTLNGNQVVLEFRSTAFFRDEFVVLSIGDITGNYEDKENNIIFEISTNSEYEKGEITDPSGRKISNDNSSTSANITINDSQKVSRVSG